MENDDIIELPLDKCLENNGYYGVEIEYINNEDCSVVE